MSTQPLLHESTSDAPEIARASLKLEDLQGLAIPCPPNSGQEQSNFFELLQDTPIIQECGEYTTVHELALFNNLKEEFSEIFSSFIPVLKAKDFQLYRHSMRVHSLTLSFTTNTLKLSEARSLKIGLAAFFHDIGKMHINNAILHKATALTRREYEIIKHHPAYGAEMISQYKLIKNVIPPLYHHHERIDGKGYPDGLRGDTIPLGARIIAIVDAFEVMTSQRNYQKSRTPIQAYEELHKHAGTQFDAELVELYYKFLEQFLQM
jgi:putative nucleotidyltransferase with HDIG domain